jgi:hypothetical protein
VADNFVTNPVTTAGGATFAADDINSVYYPRVKLSWGADGSAADASASAPLPVTLAPIATGGCTIFRSIDVDEGTLEVVKASAGTLYGWSIYNTGSVRVYVKICNVASGSVNTADIDLTIPLEADQGSNISIPQGMAFSVGICIGATTGVADNDTGAPAANAVIANLFYV